MEMMAVGGKWYSFLPAPIFSVCAQSLTRGQLFAALRTVPAKLLCSWDFPGKNTFPSPGDLSEPTSRVSPALADMFFTTSTTWEVPRLPKHSLFIPSPVYGHLFPLRIEK